MVVESKGKSRQTDSPQPVERTLTVRASRVRVGGAVRVNERVLQELGFTTRGVVEVAHGERTAALHLFADPHVDSRHIVVRPPDMKRLGVQDGEPVTLRTYTSGGAALRRGAGRIASRVAGRLDLSESETEHNGGE